MLYEMLYDCFKTNIYWPIQYLSRAAVAWLYLSALRVGLPLQVRLHAPQAISLQHFLGSRLDAAQLSPALKPSLHRLPFTYKIKAICYCGRKWHSGWDEWKFKDCKYIQSQVFVLTQCCWWVRQNWIKCSPQHNISYWNRFLQFNEQYFYANKRPSLLYLYCCYCWGGIRQHMWYVNKKLVLFRVNQSSSKPHEAPKSFTYLYTHWICQMQPTSVSD